MARHTDTEIEQAAQRFEKLTDTLDPAAVEAQHINDLRNVAAAADAARG